MSLTPYESQMLEICANSLINIENQLDNLNKVLIQFREDFVVSHPSAMRNAINREIIQKEKHDKI